MTPRIIFAGLVHESHTFLEQRTGWDDFHVSCDRAIFDRRGDGSTTDGFLAEAERQAWQVIPTVLATAPPSGTVEDTVFERCWREFEARARPAVSAGVDGIFLVLHGAMATETQRDPEGELLARIRALPGAQSVPIFGVLDLHANLSARTCAGANGLVMYRENPHTDARQSVRRAAALLGRCLREQRVPRMLWCRAPVMWAPTGTATAADPMRALRAYATELERLHPEIWACNVAAGYSFADTPDTGCSLSVVTTASEREARTHLEVGARLAWSLRERGAVHFAPVDQVVERLAAASSDTSAPILLLEPSDNIGAGAPGDGTGVLRALLEYRIERSLVVINDPLTVAALQDVPTGETRKVLVGGRGSRLDPGPVELAATLVSRSDGRFTLEDPHSPLAARNGIHIMMGPCAVVRSGGVTILLTSRRTPPVDLGQLRSQGIEPREFAVIGVKAAVAHKRAYDPISRVSHYVDTPGPCTSNLASLPWNHVERPIWPLDTMMGPAVKFA